MSIRILLAGGGTGGHTVPLIAVAESIKALDPKAEVHYVGLASDIHREDMASLPIFTSTQGIESGKLHRYLFAPHWGELRKLLRGFAQAKQFIHTLKPDVVFTKGGYVTVPIAFHAWRAGIPVVIHESDSVSGLANQMLSRLATKVFSAFPSNKKNVSWIGLPVRQAFREEQPVPQWLLTDVPVLTIVGGSQGAGAVNRLVFGCWEQLLAKWQVVHVVGEAHVDDAEARAAELPAELRARLHIRAFIKGELPYLFQKSEVVISRAGSSIFELAASRSAVLLIPLSTASRNHQNANAKILGDAVVVLDETTASAQDLADAVRVVAEPKRNAQLREGLAVFDKADAGERLAQALIDLAS
jgi:UDP-N-acetylglucosamine--N-acetylmuramyl-(pentapeptide) pyrophosphoryl-undecaprenol N-acetylglucosamine transferase